MAVVISRDFSNALKHFSVPTAEKYTLLLVIAYCCPAANFGGAMIVGATNLFISDFYLGVLLKK
ncbi:MAG TPA: hypothetical protein PKX40_17030 [Spirochaetota bacterium]|nr:hypothetical protein [Spirochaetota bacterium]